LAGFPGSRSAQAERVILKQQTKRRDDHEENNLFGFIGSAF
jgi:hypothetical protein